MKFISSAPRFFSILPLFCFLLTPVSGFAQDVAILPTSSGIYSEKVAVSSEQMAGVFADFTKNLKKFNSKTVIDEYLKNQATADEATLRFVHGSAIRACRSAGYKDASHIYSTSATAEEKAQVFKTISPTANYNDESYGIKKGGEVVRILGNENDNECEQCLCSAFACTSNKDGCLDSIVRCAVCCPLLTASQFVCLPCIVWSGGVRVVPVTGFSFKQIYCTNDETAGVLQL